MKKAIVLLYLTLFCSCSYFVEPLERHAVGVSGPLIFEVPSLPPNFKLEPTFESIKVGILGQKCLFCHSPGKKAERVPLVTREDLINSPQEIVIPGNSEESGLILSLAPDARKPMPPKKSNLAAVSPEEINILKQWIDQGAL